jgi:hypothetical protein
MDFIKEVGRSTIQNRSSMSLEKILIKQFYISRTLKTKYSGFFETIPLRNRFTQLFSVKNREKDEKKCDKHSFDVYAAISRFSNAANK